jgi:hypothetical protein
MSQQEMLDLLTKIKTDFYTTEQKSTFFKNAQKTKCAEKITTQINLADLLKNTIYIIPNTNKVFIYYPLFKQFASDSIKENIIEYIINILIDCTSIYGHYEMHIDLNGFSISAAERYKLSIQLFCHKCLGLKNARFADLVDKLYVYNTPSIMESIIQIFSPFIDPVIPRKLVCYSKTVSTSLLDNLLYKSEGKDNMCQDNSSQDNQYSCERI